MTKRNRKKTLYARNLKKSFGDRVVVNGVDLEVSPGQVVGLLGPNGAGKTTTFYMVVGLSRPDSGKVLLGDEDVTQLPMYERARKGLSYLSQEPSVFRRLSVRQNIMVVLEARGLAAEERTGLLERLVVDLKIEHLADIKGYALSGGERRRVEIARALATDPDFILLDEPFAGIDPIAVLDIQNIIGELKDKGIGILISDHNVRETLGVCDKAYILNEGSILEHGDPRAIAESRKAREIYLGEKFSL
ncbi:MAG: LPS export ABC transporter ATP-binding protein [Geobacteraceae bacterium]|nr:LPS export ABC transporter ATP-binding protein [Geobacteraceae bacterium]